MKKLLIYNDVKPVVRRQHANLSLKKGTTFEFARETNAVPLVIAEFGRASQDFAIVFTATDEGVIPTAVLGVRNNENAFVAEDGAWQASYVPAFIRRYPFVFASDGNSTTFTLMIDEKYSGFNEENRGERLFDSDGENTGFLDQTLAFLKDYQTHFERTRAFGEKLAELDLLEAVEARLPMPDDPERRLTGFKVVNRDKLKTLSDDVLAQLVRDDFLELIFLHLFSLNNLTKLHGRLLDDVGEEIAPPLEKAPPSPKARGKKASA
ncbi:hypothetical protein GGR91_000943 [Sphingorhabdus rigui]|uniref:Multidrug transporter n=1 Tax=Sphingorhabdus rigui TaxID=1282858 RepID=A0A840AYK8_9SPHN|nr:SapC family protein [Sphingorhabdus rigui]MBB3942721.1 hypothetical protein [Sphingorhabdus rigui]